MLPGLKSAIRPAITLSDVTWGSAARIDRADVGLADRPGGALLPEDPGEFGPGLEAVDELRRDPPVHLVLGQVAGMLVQHRQAR
jgi:hypothetical protein